MKKIKKGICLWAVAAWILLAVMPLSAANQSGEETDLEESVLGSETSSMMEMERQEVFSRLISQDPQDADLPVSNPPQVAKTSYNKQFTYPEDLMLSGVFETESLFFSIPKYWECGYAYAQIEFTLSQMIQDDVPATLSFLVNNTPVYTCKMDYQYGRSQIIYVEIPLELLKEDFNVFDVTGYVRLYDEEGCIDDFSGANWVHISKDSFVEVGYELLPHGDSIACYPYPFISSVDHSGEQTCVAVSDAVNDSELAAALLLRADLAAETQEEDNITLCRFQDRSKNSSGTVLVSLASNLPDAIAEKLTEDELENTRMRVTALVKFIHDEKGDPLLLITSQNPECLMEGAMMLVDETRVTQEKGSTAWVLDNASQKIRESDVESQMMASRYTIEEIVGSGISYTGPFHQEYILYLPFSGGHALANSSKISLQFRYSENLDFRRSLITVSWGDVPIASKQLSREYAHGDSLSFTMPEDVIGTSASTLKISFDLELPELFCTPRMEDMPWAYVTGDSSLYLPMGASGRLSFDLRPYPFVESSLFNDLMVVIPDMPTAAELDTLGRVVALYGENITPYGNIQVQRASAMDLEDADYNIITLGTFENNVLIQQLNPLLAFPYGQDGIAFESSREQILSDSYARRIALMELLPWEYGENKSILVVGGLDDDTMELINTFLRKDSNTWTLAGDTVLIDDSAEARSYRFLEHKTVQEEPDLKEFLKENKESVIFTVTATGAMALLFIGCLLILLRIYGRNKKDNNK